MNASETIKKLQELRQRRLELISWADLQDDINLARLTELEDSVVELNAKINTLTMLEQLTNALPSTEIVHTERQVNFILGQVIGRLETENRNQQSLNSQSFGQTNIAIGNGVIRGLQIAIEMLKEYVTTETK